MPKLIKSLLVIEIAEMPTDVGALGTPNGSFAQIFGNVDEYKNHGV